MDAVLSHIYFFCVDVMMPKCALLCTRGSEDSWEPVLHFRHVGPGDAIQVSRLGGKHPFLPSHVDHCRCCFKKRIRRNP